MKQNDESAVKKMEALLDAVGESDKFDAANDELSAEELDNVTGGVNVPNFQQFMQYVRERDAKDRS
jgi:hypothetical protein